VLLGNRRPRDHWQWWLAGQLRQRGEQVLYPQLPDPDRPDLTCWLDVLAAEYAQLGDGERVVVCHSLGCALWYQASVRSIVDTPADRVLLVAPPGPAMLAQPVTNAFAPSKSNADVLDASSRARIRLVASDADPYCTEGPAAVVYAQLLRVDAETVHGAGHLTTADGYGPWPQVLRWCLEADTRFSDSRSTPNL
jgi:predicted alpha/beta hydrolase family esterase